MFIFLASFFNKKAKSFLLGRRNVFEELSTFSKRSNDAPVVWFHAASLGEFEQGLPVMQAYKDTFPEDKLLVTFFSPSGYEQRKNHPVADFTCYLPIDTKRNTRLFINTINLKAVFFIKYEYWFHYLNEIQKSHIPLYSISALFTPKHIFFKPYGRFYRKMLSFFSHTFVQNQASLDLIKGIGVKNASISGDTRFDRVIQTTKNPNDYPEIASFKGEGKLCVIGSAWPEDMHVLRSFINEAPEDLKFIIAPHEVDPIHVKEITEGINKAFVRYSEHHSISDSTQVLVLDTIGMLSSIYQYGDFSFIGGAFGQGLHNILEAVAFGLPTVYGNQGLEKFPESIALEKLGGGFVVKNSEEASHILSKLNEDEAFRANASKICRHFVEENAGATKHIIDHLKQEIS